MEPVAAALTPAMCAKELEALSESHATGSTGVAAVVRLCQDPAAAAAPTALCHLLSADYANSVWVRQAGDITPLVALLSGSPGSEAATNAARALWKLSREEADRAAIIGAGAIPPLVALLFGGPKSQAATNVAVLRVLHNLAQDAEGRAAIIGEGGIPLLVALLRSESRAAVARVLHNLAQDAEGRAAIIGEGGIPLLVALLRSESRAAVRAAMVLHDLAQDAKGPAAIIGAGAIPPLVALLFGGPKSQAATNVAVLTVLHSLAQDAEGRAAIIGEGGSPLLVALLRSESRAAVAMVLHDLAQDAKGPAAIIGAGAIPPLVALLSGGPESKAANWAAGTLGWLAKKNEASRFSMVEAGAIPLLVAMLSGGPKSKVAMRAHSALNYLHDNDANKAAIIEAGAIPLLLLLLSDGPESQAEAASWGAGTLSRLACHNEASRVAIVAAGAIPQLVALLSGGPKSEAAAAAALALSNLAKPWLSNLACGTHHTAVLEELARTQTSCSPWDRLREAMCRSASGQLVVAGVEQAITLATAVHAAALECAQESLELNGDAERHQARLESFGLDSLELPEEFVCPITWAKMQGVPPPPSLPRRAPPPRLPRLRFCRPGGGVRRPHLRALRHPFGLPRRQRLEPSHPRAAAAKRAHPEP